MRVLYLFFAIFIVSCNRRPDYLEQALAMSGANRYELEKVLNHYKENVDDKLKYQAACFLIENMPGKYTLDTMSMFVNQPYFDKLAGTLKEKEKYAEGEIYKICDSIKENLKQAANPSPVHIFDLKTIKAGFLIRHIDRCFEAKRHSAWADSISFDEFCNYILPYRTTNSYWEDSRNFFAETYSPVIDTLYSMQTSGKYVDDDIKGKYINGGIFFREHYPFLYPVTFHNLLQSRIGLCSDICSASIEAMRSVNIPAALDVIPCWGNGSNSHFMAELVKNAPIRLCDNTQQIKTKPEDELISDMFWTQDIIARADEGIPSVINISSCRTVPKIYRETYALQYNSLYFQAKGEEIPRFFKNPHFEDITKKYLACADATLVFDSALPNRFVYLCCYNPDMITLEPVAWAKIKHNKAIFHDMGINILYFPACFSDGRMEPTGSPFLLLKDGECKYMPVRPGTNDTVVLHGKMPYRYSTLKYAGMMLGRRFQVYNRPDMSDTINIHTITRLPFYGQSVEIADAPFSRFAVYQFGGLSRGDIAEMELWGLDGCGKEVKLEGKIIGNPGTYGNGKEDAMDSDRVTYFYAEKDARTYIGYDFGVPRKITRIHFCPRNDDNGIAPGELYELFYWNNAWISLGKQEGRSDNTLVYTNVPGNVLMVLHNHTRGKENRPFTYEDGKQVWW